MVGHKANEPMCPNFMSAMGVRVRNLCLPDTQKRVILSWVAKCRALRIKARDCQHETGEWRASLPNAHQMVQGKLNPPLLAQMLNDLGIVGGGNG